MRTLALAALLAVAATTAAAQAPAPPAMAMIFKSWDKDADGAISKAEWTDAGRPADRFDLVDANKDGKVTPAELEAAMAAMRQRQGQ